MPNLTTGALEHPTLTATLPPAAAAALTRLELAFAPLSVRKAVTRYEVATTRFDELDARPASQLSPAEVDAYFGAQKTVAEAFGVLAEAGRLDLIEPAEAAARYRWASVHCRRLAAVADYDGCLAAQDEMAMCRCQLSNAGRLDLIEAV